MVLSPDPQVVQPVAVFFLLAGQMLLAGTGLCAWLGLWEDKSPADNVWMRLFFCSTAGMAVDTVLLFFLGIFGILTLVPVVTLLVAGALPGAWLWWRERTARGPVPWVELATLLVLLVLCAAESVRAPGIWDDTMYHLPLARHYLQESALSLDMTTRFPLFPQHVDLLFTLGLMLGGGSWGGEILAQMLATLPLVLSGMGIMGASVWRMGSPLYGVLCMLVMWNLHLFRMYIGYAMVDMGVALFCWANLLALVLSLEATSERARFRWLLLAAVMCGMAAGSKYFGLACVVFASGLYFLFQLHDAHWNWSRIWNRLVPYVAVSLLAGGGWYVRSLVLSGNPVHPAASSLFGYFLLNPDDLHILSLEQSSHGVPKTPGNLYAALGRLNLEFLAAMPLIVLFYRRLSRGLVLIAGTCALYYLFWFSQTQVDRYIYPVIIPGLFLLCWMLHQLLAGVLAPVAQRVSLHAASRWGCLAVAGLLCWLAVAPVPRTLADWQTALGQRGGYALFAAAGQRDSAKDATLLHVGFENALYFFPGKAIGDQFGLVPYRTVVDGHSIQNKAYTLDDYMVFLGANYAVCPPEIMAEIMKPFGARLLIVNTQRFKIDLEAYSRLFTVLLQTADGVLLELKQCVPGGVSMTE